jgi:hypothetical protein
MMFIDVLLALVFIYASGAVFCSLLLEMFAAWARARAKLLQEALVSILGEQDAQKVYAHPLVSAMFERHDRPPSYLPATVFARSLLDGLRAPSEWMEPISADKVVEGIKRITHMPLRDNLASLYAASGGDLAKLEKGISEWFDLVMERMTGWYRRKTQLPLLCIAFVTVVAFNLDTFHMVRTLWTNSAFREPLVEEAVAAATTEVHEIMSEKARGTLERLEKARGTLERLPFGWTEANNPAGDRNAVTEIRNWLVRLAGWMASTLAISLGAPFWFDVLRKVVDIRATGKRLAANRESG